MDRKRKPKSIGRKLSLNYENTTGKTGVSKTLQAAKSRENRCLSKGIQELEKKFKPIVYKGLYEKMEGQAKGRTAGIGQVSITVQMRTVDR